MKKTMWDLKEERLELRLQALAQQGDWDGVVQALDDYDKNNDRRHEDRRDDFDLSCLSGGISADGHYQIPESLKLYEEDDWLDIIFSQDAEDLPNLVAEYPVSGAMQGADAPAAGNFEVEYRLWHPNQGHRQTDGVYHPEHHQAAAEGAGEDPLSGHRPAETRRSLIVLTP